MTTEALAQRCGGCGWFGLPARAWCPTCGGATWAQVDEADGAVAAVTRIRRSMSPEFEQRPIVLVRLNAVNSGGWLIAVASGVDEAAIAVGDHVRCTRVGNTVVAERRP